MRAVLEGAVGTVGLHITFAGRTDVGITRSGNEDSYLLAPEYGIFVVADGMGGHAAGAVASGMAVRLVARELGCLRGLSDDAVADRMLGAIRSANCAIFRRALREPDMRGMGTTVTALVLYQTRFLIGQVGDSRAYLLREGHLTQVTKDHSYVQDLMDAGYLTREQARSHRFGNVITRSVGVKDEVEPDLYEGTVQPRDLFLLASDGLTVTLENGRLAEILSADRTPQELADDLIAEANRQDGRDNSTAIVVRLDAMQPINQR
jgi:protein phosphatase